MPQVLVYYFGLVNLKVCFGSTQAYTYPEFNCNTHKPETKTDFQFFMVYLNTNCFALHFVISIVIVYVEYMKADYLLLIYTVGVIPYSQAILLRNHVYHSDLVVVLFPHDVQIFNEDYCKS